MRSLRTHRRSIRAIRASVLIVVLLSSVLLNVAQFTGGALSGVFELAVKSTAGLTSATAKATARATKAGATAAKATARATKAGATAAKATAQATKASATAAKATAQATKASATAARLTAQVSNLTASKKAYEASIRRVAKRLGTRVGLRAGRILTAGASQVAGSWVPYLGTATGATFITFEAIDLCQSFTEIHELEQLAGLNPTSDDFVFCGYDLSGQTKPVVSGINSLTFNGQEFKKVWFEVPEEILAHHKLWKDAGLNSEQGYYIFTERSKKNNIQTRTWLIDLDIGFDDFYVSKWACCD